MIEQQKYNIRECENYKNVVRPADGQVQYFVGPADFLSVRHKINVK